jgi:hypothetical protein
VAWTTDYNTRRPHSPIGYQTTAVYAATLTQEVDPLRDLETLRLGLLLKPR